MVFKILLTILAEQVTSRLAINSLEKKNTLS